MHVLVVNSSGRTALSVSRQLVAELVTELVAQQPASRITYRDVAAGLPFVDEVMISGLYIAPDEQTAEQRQALRLSDQLVAEVQAADVLVIGVPIYNFSIPAALKAWIDQIVRAGLTFAFLESGYAGLLHGKKVYLVVASGAVEVGSSLDFATPYLQGLLAFIGLTDVEVISAAQLSLLGEQPIGAAREAIRQVHSVA
ncbi:FMN-dependent NADH-azoreductase [Hymenobacter chitinivorans]|uniref:FMN dependent NADH:quinone oxidoreductase n=1 Tax=Hymenobacter chitinivorans DSM 11115 TaxID=1121954 RepID=A0A2M9BRR2_9BACT|nr:NAD(P)H-dependent oxidoreductase [Hymenobacter chitinivorans]PJJ60582.1 FMN-dependent NADH-azoreductase [Hymenobacter chitinivorans DSM 11115]